MNDKLKIVVIQQYGSRTKNPELTKRRDSASQHFITR